MFLCWKHSFHCKVNSTLEESSQSRADTSLMLGCDCSLGNSLGWGPVWLLCLCSSRTELHCVCFLSVDIPQTVWLLSPKSSHSHKNKMDRASLSPHLVMVCLFLFYLTYVTESLFDGVCRRHDQRLTACNQHNNTSAFFCLLNEATTYIQQQQQKSQQDQYSICTGHIWHTVDCCKGSQLKRIDPNQKFTRYLYRF